MGLAVDAVWPGGSVLLDGGLATELEARGHDLSDPLWSARLLADAPQEIVAVHDAYFRAGAMIATTASYQASFEGFAARGIDRREAAGLLRRSVELARTARDEAGADGALVAASIGPYGAALADGSEYRGRYGLSVAALKRWHRPRLETLAAAGPDVLACETVPDIDEAQALVELVRSVGKPAWLSYTIDGDRTRAGQPLADAFAVAAGVDEIVAIGVNCCAPDDVLPAIAAATAVGKPVIVYLPEQRRTLGCLTAQLDRPVAIQHGPRGAVDRGRRAHRRRMLPNRARRYRRAGGRRPASVTRLRFPAPIFAVWLRSRRPGR